MDGELMKIILENGIQKLIPSIEENWLLDKKDLEKEIQERYYFKFAYLPAIITIEECEGKYIETEMEVNNG